MKNKISVEKFAVRLASDCNGPDYEFKDKLLKHEKKQYVMVWLHPIF